MAVKVDWISIRVTSTWIFADLVGGFLNGS